MTGQPHDSVFKYTFSAPERAAEELRAVLPPEIIARVDWSTLKLEPGEFVDEELRRESTDLLFSARVAEGPTLIYVLLEHQSAPHPLMPVRMLRYLGRIWGAWTRANPEATRVPPIIPVVLHHGANGWTAPRDLSECLDCDPETLAALAPLLPQLGLLIDDLALHADEALRARAASALVKLVLLVLKHGRDAEDMDQRLLRWCELVAAVGAAPHGIDAVAAVGRYLIEVSDHLTNKGLSRVLRSAVGDRSNEVMMTIGEKLIARGERRGREKGREEATRDLLLEMLTERFGDLPPALSEKVAAAPTTDLRRWARRLLTAATLGEVFADEH
jgi:hypothetical protein